MLESQKLNSINMKSKFNQSVSSITGKLQNKFGLSKKAFIICIIGVLGLMLIVFSEFIPKGKSDKSHDDSSSVLDAAYSNTFKSDIEKELKEIISKIDGVGEVSLMLTLDGTTEYVYAEDVDTQTDENSTGKSDKYKNEVIIVDSDGNETALVKKIIEPKVKGVVIVCTGGGNIEIKERVIKAVSSALNISTNNICVEKG